jgi:hypothetical protein
VSEAGGIEEGGIDREEMARMMERLNGIKRTIEEMGAVAREGIAALDSHVVSDHPDLSDLGDELRNVYGGAFDDDPPT